MDDITAVAFIRNNNQGAFCLWESMASLLPFVTDMIILDLGSTDGTLETLQDITSYNQRVKVATGSFSCVDAKAFADAANLCVQMATYDNVLFWQADEVWHQDLLLRMEEEFDEGNYDLVFWRVQLKHNWQRIKWFPHPVHRVGPKDNFVFVGDGMNTEQGRLWATQICSEYDGGWFIRWGKEFESRPTELPTHDMILDVSQVGAFLENIVAKRKLHSPMWHEDDVIEGMPAGAWWVNQKSNPDWTKPDTPYNIPHILKRHLGRTQYGPDPEILEALKADTTVELLFP